MENNSHAPKRRGRPAGSKNKRNRVAVTNPSESMEGDGMGKETSMGMGIHVKILEVAAGCDVIGAVYDFANHHRLWGVSVISTHGTVRDVNVYQPKMPSPFLTYNSLCKLLFLKGNFYGSLSSIRPQAPFSTLHFVSFISGEGNLHVGIVQGKLTAATNVILGVAVINEIETIKLPLPRALPAPQLFSNLNGGMRTATADLLSGDGRSMTATAGLPEFSSGAGRSRMVTAGLPEFSSGAGRSSTATAGLAEFSSGAGRSRTAYGVPIAPSSPPLFSWNMVTNNFSSNSGPKDSDRSIVRGSLG